MTALAHAHPDFERVPAARRWADSLAELWKTLKHEAMADRGQLNRAWRMLPRGACVALTIDPETFRKRVRVSRSEAPGDAKGGSAWEREVATFRDHFELMKGHGWFVEPDPSATGVAVHLIELYPGEVSPGKARCHRCGVICKWDPAFAPDGNACESCLSRPRAHAGKRQLP